MPWIDVELLVAKYLAHPDVVTKNASATHFEAAIRVFVQRRVNALADPSPIPQPEPSQPASQSVTTQDNAQQPADLQNVLDRLYVLRLQLKENNKRYGYYFEDKEEGFFFGEHE